MRSLTNKEYFRLSIKQWQEVKISYTAYDWQLENKFNDVRAAQVAKALNANLEYYINRGYALDDVRFFLMEDLNSMCGGEIPSGTADIVYHVTSMIFEGN